MSWVSVNVEDLVSHFRGQSARPCRKLGHLRRKTYVYPTSSLMRCGICIPFLIKSKASRVGYTTDEIMVLLDPDRKAARRKSMPIGAFV